MTMPEYNEFRCCLCPQINSDRQICPAPDGDKPCRFVKQYTDERGWTYFVRSGIGGETFKTFYLKPGKLYGGHGWRGAPWRHTFDAAQADLNKIAKQRNWQECI